MHNNPFIGTWTYRSFKDIPEPVEDFDEIRLWQAQLILIEDGPGLVKGSIASGDYELQIRGAVWMEESDKNVRLRAEGLKGTNTDGWVYDYVGVLAEKWPDGDAQRPAIVGTVMRTMPHPPDRQANQTYSFVAVNTAPVVSTYELPGNVINHFADRLHRLHHAAWHGIRNRWLNMSDEQRRAVTELDWQIEGNRYALEGERTRPAASNGSGEDFLFFHRQMVVAYKSLMTEAGEKPIEWAEIPQPGADGPQNSDGVPAAWPIPPAPFLARRFAALKTDEFFWSRMRWWDYEFKNPAFLASLTLGQLGSLIEFSVHNDMHIRWSAVPRDPVTNVILPTGRPDWDISTKWNSPKYDWLGEFYASHVNPIFWRLHGWIDDRIEDWFKAHELSHPGVIKRVSKGGVDWFEGEHWVAVEYPWVWPRSLGGYEGGHGGHHGHHDHDLYQRRLASLEKVVPVLFPPPAKDQKLLELVSPAFEPSELAIGSVVGQ